MAIVNGSLQEGYKNAAWFAANPTLVLLEGQRVNLEQTGTYKLGDGVTALSALSFLGASSGSVVHNDTTGKQGGTTNEYYHLTNAQLTVVQNTSNTNTGDETAARIGAIVNGAADYPTPLDADKIGIWDVANSLFKALTWANLKATLKTYFDTLYAHGSLYNMKFSGEWWFSPGTGARTQAAGLAGNIWLVPIIIEKDTIVTDIGVMVQAGLAASNVRAAIYIGDNTGGRPKTLVVDSGNMASITSGLKSVTFGSPITLLASNKVYWLGLQCSAGTSIYYTTMISHIMGTTAAANSSAHILAQAYGAFPADVSAATFTTNTLNFAIPLKIQ